MDGQMLGKKTFYFEGPPPMVGRASVHDRLDRTEMNRDCHASDLYFCSSSLRLGVTPLGPAVVRTETPLRSGTRARGKERRH
jgi:hypothetical protein